MYIDQDSYAFLGAEWHYTPSGLRRAPELADSRALRVAYQPYAGRWHLKTVWWQTRAKLPIGPLLHYFGEFLTTAIDTAQAAPLMYLERAQYHDVFLRNAVAYDSAFWQGQTTLLPPPAVRQVLLDQQRQQRADSLFRRARADTVAALAAGPARPGLRLLSRLSYGGTLGQLPLTVTGGNVAVDFAPAGYAFRAQGTAGVATQNITGYWSAEYGFDITPKLMLRLATRHVFRQLTGDGWEAGLSYQHNLNPRHRPLYGRIGLAYTRQAVARCLGTFANTDTGLRVAGAHLGADELSLSVQSLTEAMLPKLGLGLELSHKFELVADLGYLLPLCTRTQLQVDEESGFFLTRSSTAVDLPHTDVSLHLNDQPTTNLPWQLNHWLLSFGLVYRLR